MAWHQIKRNVQQIWCRNYFGNLQQNMINPTSLQPPKKFFSFLIVIVIILFVFCCAFLIWNGKQLFDKGFLGALWKILLQILVKEALLWATGLLKRCQWERRLIPCIHVSFPERKKKKKIIPRIFLQSIKSSYSLQRKLKLRYQLQFLRSILQAEWGDLRKVYSGNEPVSLSYDIRRVTDRWTICKFWGLFYS